ncbi:MAG: hypothetical protein JNN12_12300 [Bacteroidetes Order II. Incertae sedis bacterium]|nr:hypothetical protein [Bacteroidetes Order II. bacterium]
MAKGSDEKSKYRTWDDHRAKLDFAKEGKFSTFSDNDTRARKSFVQALSVSLMVFTVKTNIADGATEYNSPSNANVAKDLSTIPAYTIVYPSNFYSLTPAQQKALHIVGAKYANGKYDKAIQDFMGDPKKQVNLNGVYVH